MFRLLFAPWRVSILKHRVVEAVAARAARAAAPPPLAYQNTLFVTASRKFQPTFHEINNLIFNTHLSEPARSCYQRLYCYQTADSHGAFMDVNQFTPYTPFAFKRSPSLKCSGSTFYCYVFERK